MRIRNDRRIFDIFTYTFLSRRFDGISRESHAIESIFDFKWPGHRVESVGFNLLGINVIQSALAGASADTTDCLPIAGPRVRAQRRHLKQLQYSATLISFCLRIMFTLLHPIQFTGPTRAIVHFVIVQCSLLDSFNSKIARIHWPAADLSSMIFECAFHSLQWCVD